MHRDSDLASYVLSNERIGETVESGSNREIKIPPTAEAC